jgi:serine/threonine-protein kinase
MALVAGSILGPYRIEALLGAGGMGEVYRARDTRLNRTVAIKILATRLTDTPHFRKRFEREARVIAALEHPHICPLYDVGDDGGTRFLVMQHLQGETLASLLQRGALPIERAVDYGIQIAEGLQAAHRAGVVHRDLKPANVMITKTGVKLLDFGLAQTGVSDLSVNAMTRTATLLQPLTGEGTLMGTLPYMAPEQVEGRTADPRTDIFALGAVLYEMTTGQRAFAGTSQASVVTAIMSSEPPLISASRDGVPRTLDRVVKKCLAKDPDARWQDAGDLAAELRWSLERAELESTAPGRAARWSYRWIAGVVLAASVASAAAAWLLKPASHTSPGAPAHFAIDLPPRAELELLAGPILTLSPDGRHLVYVARQDGKRQLFLRAIDRLDSKALAEADGSPSLFFSPDGQSVGFFSGGSLKTISLGGGAPVSITTVGGGSGASWGSDGRIVFARSNRTPLSRVAASGGEAQEVTTLDPARRERSHRWPEVLPGGRAVVFTAGPPAEGPWHDADIVVQSLDTGERRTLIRGAAQARYVATGHIAYSRAGTLYAVPFDAASLQVTGPAVALLDDVLESPVHGSAQFDVSDNGTLAYVTGGLETTEVVWVSPRGEAKALMPQERRVFEQPRLSPDGRQLALTVGGGDDATFVYDLTHGRLSRVTSGANHLAPTWTADGEGITTRLSTSEELVTSGVNRSGSDDVLYRGAGVSVAPASWSPDGRVLVFMRENDIWALTMPERRAEPIVQSQFIEWAPAISPDGRWLAYSSNESGRHEVYVQPFRAAGRRWQVSQAGGTEPVWARNAQRLFFRQDVKLMAVAGRPPFGGAVELFNAPWAWRQAFRPQYDVAPDGEGFVMIRSTNPAPRIHVILNWAEELSRRVPR